MVNWHLFLKNFNFSGGHFEIQNGGPNGKTGTHLFSWSVKFLDMNKYGCQESTQKFALFT